MNTATINSLSICDLARTTSDICLLRELSDSDDISIKRAIAANVHTPRSLLWALVLRDKDMQIFRSAAKHRNATPDMIYVIIKNCDSQIYSDIAGSHCIPDEIASHFAETQPWEICEKLLCNPVVSSDILMTVASRFSGHATNLYLAMNEQTPDKKLRELSSSDDDTIKWYLAKNRNTPSDILDRLSADKTCYIASAARMTLKSRI